MVDVTGGMTRKGKQDIKSSVRWGNLVNIRFTRQTEVEEEVAVQRARTDVI